MEESTSMLAKYVINRALDVADAVELVSGLCENCVLITGEIM